MLRLEMANAAMHTELKCCAYKRLGEGGGNMLDHRFSSEKRKKKKKTGYHSKRGNKSDVKN